ncbi:MAG: hypothetical protein WC047_00410 [Kiritimatiellales bacterium]
MGVERVDYYSNDEYQQALLSEQQDVEQEPDQIDMMTESELRIELRTALIKIESQRRGEFVCLKCGLRQQEEINLNDIPF